MIKFKHSLLPLATALSMTLFTQNASALSGEDFEFHGYFRSGIGANSEGGDQICFQVPGVGWKYRLGNECETYIETNFVANFFRGQDDSFFKGYLTFAYVVEGEADFEQFEPAVRESWIEGGNIAGGFLSGARFWAGKRFYRRHDVHINDFYFWDVSGPGGGVEDIDLGFGKTAFAVFRGVTDSFGTVIVDGEVVPINEIDPDAAATRLDWRVYEIDTNEGGQLTVGLDARFSDENENRAADDEGENGWGLNLLHFQDDALGLGGFNKVIFQYGQGAAGTRLGAAATNVDADSDAKSFRIVEQLLVEPSEDYSVLAELTYENNSDNNGLGGFTPGEDREWWSFGIRPKFYITDYFNIALELGYDYIEFDRDNGDDEERYMTKFTIAPQLSAGRGFWVRPLLRAFVTYADWNDEVAEAGFGGDAFDDTNGWSFGLQAESWW